MIWLPKKFHIELTNICVAKCPFCIRTKNGVSKFTQLTIKDIKFFFTKEVLYNLEMINLCGSWGDPIYAKDFLEIVEFFSIKKIRVVISTNGFNNIPGFWERLGKNNNLRVTFGIDGITQSTHGAHRVGTNLKQVLINAKKFTDAGGYAVWQFLVFATNEYQLDRAKIISQQLGFSDFVIRTSRDYSDALPKPIKQFEFRGESLEQGEVFCEYKERKQWYISAYGQVLPCCFLGDTEFQKKYLQNELMNIKKYSFEQIQYQSIWLPYIGKIVSDSGINICEKTCSKKGRRKQKSLTKDTLIF